MHLFYYDEVKHGPTQPAFWMGGICVPASAVQEIEEAVAGISERVFGSHLLSKETEFHGIEIVRGKGNAKRVAFDDRVAIFQELLAILVREDIRRVAVKILPENFVVQTKDPGDVAFMYLVEGVERTLRDLESIGMMFGDYDEPNIARSVGSLSHFRRHNIKWSGGREIRRIIDTVHFAQSHHSRMIQLADVFLYSLQFMDQPNDSRWRSTFASLIEESGVTRCHSRKTWPLEKVWYGM